MDRRTFLALTGTGAAVAGLPRVRGGWRDLPDLSGASVADLLLGQERGTFSARDLVQGYLRRIGDLDARGPSLRSIIETNPDATDIADALDRERKSKGPRGPLQ